LTEAASLLVAEISRHFCKEERGEDDVRSVVIIAVDVEDLLALDTQNTIQKLLLAYP